MKPPDNQVDQYGFPLPKKFDDQHPEPPGAGRRPAGKSPLTKLLLAVVLLGVAVALVVESPLGSAARDMWVRYLAERGVEKFRADDIPGALGDLDAAIAWLTPSTDATVAAEIYLIRAQVRLDAQQVSAAKEDADQAVAANPQSVPAYLVRSLVWQRLGEFRRAIDDANLAVERRKAKDANVFNTRAYARALAGIELEEALADADQAIAFWPVESAAFLDTRGYIQLLLGHPDPALADLNRAIELAEQDRQRELTLAHDRGLSKRVVERLTRRHDHDLSVMYHHRGKVYQHLGRSTEAKADLSQADRLGYNPAAGVF